ncbi:MAG: hypothetical protein FWE59_06790, partial [Oscillospiraceae bacterium]|nr:hypothetical protein [Oscillospiraceae bacterium]
FGKGAEGAINCANKSILLSDALTHIGIFAMPVAITNWIFDTDSEVFMNGSSHVVAHVFLPEMSKWIVLDPSFNTYIVDDQLRPLNLIEIAAANRDGEPFFSVDANEKALGSKGLACLLCSLPHIQIWRGNDYSNRVGKFTWDTAYRVKSEKSLRQAEYLLKNHTLPDWQRVNLESYLSSDKISVDDLLTPPKLHILER